MKKKKEDLLSKPWFWVVWFVSAVAVAVAVILIIRYAKRAEQPVPSTEPTRMTKMEMDVDPDVPAIMEGGLLIKQQGSYSGFFMEDGSDQEVTDVMMIVVENQSGKDLQLSRIVMEYSDFSAVFQVTNLPAGASAMVLEQNAHKSVEETAKATRMEDMVFFQEPMSLQADLFEYSLSEGVIMVTNKSDKAISGDIYVYYKNFSEELYRGGITYRAKIEGGLKAGETKEVAAGHYSMELSRLLAIQYAG